MGMYFKLSFLSRNNFSVVIIFNKKMGREEILTYQEILFARGRIIKWWLGLKSYSFNAVWVNRNHMYCILNILKEKLPKLFRLSVMIFVISSSIMCV